MTYYMNPDMLNKEQGWGSYTNWQMTLRNCLNNSLTWRCQVSLSLTSSLTLGNLPHTLLEACSITTLSVMGEPRNEGGRGRWLMYL